MRKMHGRRQKVTPKLNLDSARVFIGQGAGLAPTREHTAPPIGGNLHEDRGGVKGESLRQEYSSKNTSLNSKKVPAIHKMVQAIGGVEGCVFSIQRNRTVQQRRAGCIP